MGFLRNQKKKIIKVVIFRDLDTKTEVKTFICRGKRLIEKRRNNGKYTVGCP